MLKKEIRQLGLDLLDCRGQGHDGAGNMAGKCNGASALIKREFPKALFVHCASHCITASCDNLEIKNMIYNVKRAADFFNNSPKRQGALEANIERLAKGKPISLSIHAEQDGLSALKHSIDLWSFMSQLW